MIDSRSIQVVQHIGGRAEPHALVGLAGPPSDDLGQNSFADAGIAN